MPFNKQIEEEIKRISQQLGIDYKEALEIICKHYKGGEEVGTNN